MATQTLLTHPNQARQGEAFYPYDLTIKAPDADGELAVLLTSKCAYEPSPSPSPGPFEDEAPAKDRILLPAWHAAIASKSLAILQMGGLTKRFEVSDVLPSGEGPNRTLLVVTPWKG